MGPTHASRVVLDLHLSQSLSEGIPNYVLLAVLIGRLSKRGEAKFILRHFSATQHEAEQSLHTALSS